MEYLELAAKTDAAVEASEPDMLHHTFDQDPERKNREPEKMAKKSVVI